MRLLTNNPIISLLKKLYFHFDRKFEIADEINNMSAHEGPERHVSFLAHHYFASVRKMLCSYVDINVSM